MRDFEKAFSDFLEYRGFDAVEEALFTLVRIAFKAGWTEAGGEISEFQTKPDDSRVEASQKHNVLEFFQHTQKVL